MTDMYDKILATIKDKKQNQIGKDKLTDQQKRKISAAYTKLYEGLVMLNLLDGKKLGASMYSAMEHIESFTQAKTSDTPAAVYLRQVHATYRITQSKQMMTHKNKDMVLNITESARTTLHQQATNQIKDSMAAINSVLYQYKNVYNKHKGDNMPNNMSENGSMTYSAKSASATHSQNAVNPSKSIMESDQERDARLKMHTSEKNMNQEPRNLEQPENGSMMKSAKSAGNSTSANTVNPSKTIMPTQQMATVQDKGDSKIARFKAAQAKLVDFGNEKSKKSELTREQIKMILQRQQQGRMIA